MTTMALTSCYVLRIMRIRTRGNLRSSASFLRLHYNDSLLLPFVFNVPNSAAQPSVRSLTLEVMLC